ncbi:hypothetical protein C8F01DRAFT_1243859 [Mycena amicta]|nr:hypothetical protein C8F01DRAFT_1243859 [Mycena amicta]
MILDDDAEGSSPKFSSYLPSVVPDAEAGPSDVPPPPYDDGQQFSTVALLSSPETGGLQHARRKRKGWKKRHPKYIVFASIFLNFCLIFLLVRTVRILRRNRVEQEGHGLSGLPTQNVHMHAMDRESDNDFSRGSGRGGRGRGKGGGGGGGGGGRSRPGRR